MKIPRRQFLSLAASAVALPAMVRSAWAQSYPTRQVRVIVPFAPVDLPMCCAAACTEALTDPWPAVLC